MTAWTRTTSRSGLAYRRRSDLFFFSARLCRRTFSIGSFRTTSCATCFIVCRSFLEKLTVVINEAILVFGRSSAQTRPLPDLQIFLRKPMAFATDFLEVFLTRNKIFKKSFNSCSSLRIHIYACLNKIVGGQPGMMGTHSTT